MEISTSSNTVTIEGNIKSVSDFQDIKTTFDSLKKNNTSIIVKVVDSISITSSVIGYLNKLVHKDKINIQLKVGNEQLILLLKDLNLVGILNVTKA